MEHMSTEAAWAAGFYDGEGSTSVWRSHTTVTTMTISQVDRRSLDRFLAVVGEGRVNGPYEVHSHPERQPIFYWKATGARAHRAMRIIWPYLGTVKREQYEDVVAEVKVLRGGVPEHEKGTDTCRRGHTGDWYVRPGDGRRECYVCIRAQRQRQAENA